MDHRAVPLKRRLSAGVGSHGTAAVQKLLISPALQLDG